MDDLAWVEEEDCRDHKPTSAKNVSMDSYGLVYD